MISLCITYVVCRRVVVTYEGEDKFERMSKSYQDIYNKYNLKILARKTNIKAFT